MNTYSSMTDVIVQAHPTNFTHRRNQPIRKITPHHVAGNLSVEQVGRIFQNESRNASSNYALGRGRIAGIVPEESRAWTSGSPNNDHQAITIEVSNSANGHPWPILDSDFDLLVDFCADLIRRNSTITRQDGVTPGLWYDGTANGSLTRHNTFMATTCPGPTLQARFPELVSRVNSLLDLNLEPLPLQKLNPQPPINLLLLVQKVIRGNYGNQPQRHRNLMNKGLTYEQANEVQRQVNLNWDSTKQSWKKPIKLY